MKIVAKNSRKHRFGFTLLEMVLVIAIMLMMSVYLYSTFKVVNYSHLEVSQVNDMHDYASLNLKAIENNLCNATKIKSGSSNISCDGYYVLLNGAQILPGFSQYHYGSEALWRTQLSFTTNPGSKTVLVKISLTNVAKPNVTYNDEVLVYCPSCKEMDAMSGAGGINFSNAA